MRSGAGASSASTGHSSTSTSASKAGAHGSKPLKKCRICWKNTCQLQHQASPPGTRHEWQDAHHCLQGCTAKTETRRVEKSPPQKPTTYPQPEPQSERHLSGDYCSCTGRKITYATVQILGDALLFTPALIGHEKTYLASSYISTRRWCFANMTPIKSLLG